MDKSKASLIVTLFGLVVFGSILALVQIRGSIPLYLQIIGLLSLIPLMGGASVFLWSRKEWKEKNLGRLISVVVLMLVITAFIANMIAGAFFSGADCLGKVFIYCGIWETPHGYGPVGPDGGFYNFAPECVNHQKMLERQGFFDTPESCEKILEESD